MQLKKYVCLLLLVVILGFLLGWIFPVEGPIDYVYDNYKAQRCATKNSPLVIEVKGLSEDELNFIEESSIVELIIGDRE